MAARRFRRVVTTATRTGSLNDFVAVIGHPFQNGFDLELKPDRLDQPHRWRMPRMIFVNSMSDLFHKKIPTDYIDRVFDVMEATPRHTFQMLTKRSSIMRRYINRRYADGVGPSHIWLGVSVEDSQRLSRLEHLRQTRATVRFLSAEPLLDDLGPVDFRGIHWVIVGGESGPRARPMKQEWVRNIRRQCLHQQVPFFFKQWGGFRPKSGGRLLDGREWNEYPAQQHYAE